MIELLFDNCYVIPLLFISAGITYLTTKVLDAYMAYGEVFDFIRLRIAKFFEKRTGVFVDFESTINRPFEDYESDFPYFDRQDEMKKKYWALAYHSKLFKLFLCPDCFSVYIGIAISLVFSIPLIEYIGWGIVPLYVFCNNLITWKFLNWESE